MGRAMTVYSDVSNSSGMKKKKKEKRRGIKEGRKGIEERGEEREGKQEVWREGCATLSPQDAFPSQGLGNNITPIKGRLGKNTTPTRRNSEKPIQRRRRTPNESSRTSSIHLLQTSSA